MGEPPFTGATSAGCAAVMHELRAPSTKRAVAAFTVAALPVFETVPFTGGMRFIDARSGPMIQRRSSLPGRSAMTGSVAASVAASESAVQVPSFDGSQTMSSVIVGRGAGSVSPTERPTRVKNEGCCASPPHPASERRLMIATPTTATRFISHLPSSDS